VSCDKTELVDVVMYTHTHTHTRARVTELFPLLLTKRYKFDSGSGKRRNIAYNLMLYAACLCCRPMFSKVGDIDIELSRGGGGGDGSYKLG